MSFISGEQGKTSPGRASAMYGNQIALFCLVPGPVSTVSVDLFNASSDCDATKVMINWSEPILRDRNALIKAYIIPDVSESYPVSNPNPYSRVSRTFSKEVQNLNAETDYTWKVCYFYAAKRAVHNLNNSP